MIKPLPIEKTDKRGSRHTLDEYKLNTRKAQSVSGDHSDNEHEEFYLLNGTVEATIGTETTTISEPSYMYVPPGVYRKIVAVTDTQFLFRKWPI